MRYTELRRCGLGQLCRRCMNTQFKLALEPVDCLYWQYPAVCACCQETGHIVQDVRLTRRWKLWRGRKNRRMEVKFRDTF